jgi:hypothetical protein
MILLVQYVYDQGGRRGCEYKVQLDCRPLTREQPTGTLGPPVIKHLVDHGIDVTTLSRNTAQAAKNFPPSIKHVQIDYSSTTQLTDVLREGQFDSLIILINRHQNDPQLKLIDAAVTAQIPHIIPSSFGITSTHPEILRLPQVKEKFEMEKYLVDKADQGLVSYTAINSGLFFDW